MGSFVDSSDDDNDNENSNGDWLFGSFGGYGGEGEKEGDHDQTDDETNNNSIDAIDDACNNTNSIDVSSLFVHDDISIAMKLMREEKDDEFRENIRRDSQQQQANFSISDTARIKRYWGRIHAIKRYMGSMALCRGTRGDMLREAGAIETVLWILAKIWDLLPHVSLQEKDDQCCNTEKPLDERENEAIAVLELGIVCLGAIRDLACGNALNRNAVREFQYTNASTWDCGVCPSNKEDSNDKSTINGIEVLAMYVKRYHMHSWNTILGTTFADKLQLRLFTNVVGALRNVTHSSRENCQELHGLQVSKMLRWRLLYATDDSDNHNTINNDENVVKDTKSNQQASISGTISTKRLPDASQPWREASYRTAGTLINLAEKCEDCAIMCGSDHVLIELLIEAWGGAATTSGDSNKKIKPKQTPLLHLGLAAILQAAKEELQGSGLFAETWHDILAKEEERKRIAQRKEEERMKRVSKSTTVK